MSAVLVVRTQKSPKSTIDAPKSPKSTIDAFRAKPSEWAGHCEEKTDLDFLCVGNSEIIRTSAINKSMDVAISRTTPMRPYPTSLTALRSTRGMRYLCEAEGGRGGIIHNLAPHMIGQGPLQCAPTSLAVALNSLSMKGKNGEILRFTKDGLSEDLSRTVVPTPRHIFFSVSLKELGEQATRCVAMSRNTSMRATTVHGNATTANEFRRKVRAALVSGGAVVANFSRQTLGYTTSPFAGHCSPLVAYHEATDSFLVMDVAIKSWEPVWVSTAVLFKGMNTVGQDRDTMERQLALFFKGKNTVSQDRETMIGQLKLFFKGMHTVAQDRDTMESKTGPSPSVTPTAEEWSRNGRGFILLEQK